MIASTSQPSRLGLPIAFENVFGRSRKCRDSPSLCSRPSRRLRPNALLVHGMVKAVLIELDALVASGIRNEIQRETEGVVEFESLCSVE